MDENRYTVHVDSGTPGGWEVRIQDPHGGIVLTRACADETEARVFASTVQQHIYWLSPGAFRDYYRLPEPASEKA
jgi:hypothetical protein